MSAVHALTATDYDNALLRLIDLATNDRVIAAAIAGGGAGYVVGDVLDVSGGTVVSGLVTQLEVTSVAVGVIDGIRVLNCGAYSAQPGNPVSVTGGTGAGATFNLTFETQNWTVNRNVASSAAGIDYPTIAGGGGTQILEREVQLQGPGNGGTDEIYVGILEVRDNAVGSYNWALAGFTGYNGGQNWEDQPGFSHVSPNEIAAFTALTNSSIDCWFYVMPRFLMGVMRIGSTYNSFFLGFLNPFAVATDFPYPLYISGSTSKWNELFSTTGLNQSGLVDPGANTGTGGNLRGPAGVRFTDGVWYDIKNWNFTGGSRSATNDRCVYPGQQVLPGSGFIAAADQFVASQALAQWGAIIPDTGIPGAQSVNLFPSENPSGDETVLVPNAVYFTQPALQILGEIPDVFWGSTIGNNIVSQDRVIINGIYYQAFQNCNRTDPFSFVFIKEDV